MEITGRSCSQVLALLLLVAMTSCGNTSSEKKSNNESESEQGAVDKSEIKMPAAGSEHAMEKAKSEGKTVFLVITGTGAANVGNAAAIASEAKAMVEESEVYLVNKDDVANQDLVRRFSIATIPVPFLLVVSPKGNAVAGGQPHQINASQMVQAIPTPCQDDVYVALGEKKPVFIVVSRAGNNDKPSVLSVCKKSTSGAAVVEFDYDNGADKGFLSRLGINNINGSTLTVVVNPLGQVTQTFSKVPSVRELDDAAVKVIPQSGGCCPGGSGKGC